MSRSITATVRLDFDFTEMVEEMITAGDLTTDEEIRDYITEDLAEGQAVGECLRRGLSEYINVEIHDENSTKDSDSSLLNRLADAAEELIEDRNGSSVYLLELIEEARSATSTRLDRATDLLDRVKTTLTNFPEFEHNQARYGDILDDLDEVTKFQNESSPSV